MTENEAPDIANGFPSGGVRIGPAWRTTWSMLADHEWHKGVELSKAVAELHELSPTTIKGLLSQAAEAGLLERETRFAGKIGGYTTKTPPLRPAWYRRTQ